MDIFMDKYNKLCMALRKYIEKMCGSFERMFVHPPTKNITSTVEKNDHQEFDTSNLLDDE